MKYTEAETARVRGVLVLLLITGVFCLACIVFLPPWTWCLGCFAVGFMTCTIAYVAQRVITERLVVENANLTQQNTIAGHRSQEAIGRLTELQRLVARANVLSDLQGTRLKVVTKQRDDLQLRFDATREQLEQINRLQRIRGLAELLEHWEPPKNQEPS